MSLSGFGWVLGSNEHSGCKASLFIAPSVEPHLAGRALSIAAGGLAAITQFRGYTNPKPQSLLGSAVGLILSNSRSSLGFTLLLVASQPAFFRKQVSMHFDSFS